MQVKSDQDLKQLSGASPGFSRASNKRSTTAVSAAAMDYHTLPQNAMSSELAENVMEASFARGLAAAECFEVNWASAILYNALYFYPFSWRSSGCRLEERHAPARRFFM